MVKRKKFARTQTVQYKMRYGYLFLKGTYHISDGSCANPIMIKSEISTITIVSTQTPYDSRMQQSQ